jgi:hypothetical protein
MDYEIFFYNNIRHILYISYYVTKKYKIAYNKKRSE